MLKRDIQGKFALKDDDYRQVRSLRLTDETWKALGIAAECLGMTRADYVEQVIRRNAHPSITREKKLAHEAKTSVVEVATTPLKVATPSISSAMGSQPTSRNCVHSFTTTR